jgi:ribosomal protein S20
MYSGSAEKALKRASGRRVQSAEQSTGVKSHLKDFANPSKEGGAEARRDR